MRTCPAGGLGVARTPSPAVRLGPRALGSLGCRRRFAIMASLGGIRRLSGHGRPLAEFRPCSRIAGKKNSARGFPPGRSSLAEVGQQISVRPISPSTHLLATVRTAFTDAEASGVGSAAQGAQPAAAPQAGSAPQPGSQQPLPAEQSGSPPQQLVPQQLLRACLAFSAANRSRIGWHFFRVPQHEAAPQLGSQQPAPASQAGSAQPLPGFSSTAQGGVRLRRGGRAGEPGHRGPR